MHNNDKSIIAQGVTDCQALCGALDRVDAHMTQAAQVKQYLSDYYKSIGKHNVAHNIDNCGSYIQIATYNDDTHTSIISKANFCKAALCPLCAWRRHLRYSNRIRHAIALTDNDNMILYHIVLAIPNMPTITKSDIMYIKRRGKIFLQRKLGIADYISNIEITQSDKGYHPHLHILAMSRFITVTKDTTRERAAQWQKIYDKHDNKYAGYTCYITGCTSTEDKRSATWELTKYLVKPEGIQLSRDNIAILADAIHGVRKMSAGGKLADYMRKAKIMAADNRTQWLDTLSQHDVDYSVYQYINGKYVRRDD